MPIPNADPRVFARHGHRVQRERAVADFLGAVL